jgi:hypothetical protein
MAQAAQVEAAAYTTEMVGISGRNWNEGRCGAYQWMAPALGAVHLVRVITDDLEYQIWVAATSRDEAVSRVLDCVPEGWSASLLDQGLDPKKAAGLKLRPGDVRVLRK